jgi:hypothetical protein
LLDTNVVIYRKKNKNSAPKSGKKERLRSEIIGAKAQGGREWLLERLVLLNY